MDFFHQTFNSVGENVMNINTFTNFVHNLHFHKSFELAYVTRAQSSIMCTVGKKSYQLKEKDFVMILPYEIHSFIIPPDCELWIIVFSSNYIKSFSKIVSDKCGERSVFRCDDSTERFVYDSLISPVPLFTEKPSEQFSLMVKACLYAVCHEFLKKVPLINNGKGYDSITEEILDYISDHFSDDISLKDVAEALKYNYQYLSRIFNQTMGVNFKTLVNHYRFEYAKLMLLETDRSISEIAFESGFQSIRSFNRICMEIAGRSPGAIRNQKN